jgi:hypothetical protein
MKVNLSWLALFLAGSFLFFDRLFAASSWQNLDGLAGRNTKDPFKR